MGSARYDLQMPAFDVVEGGGALITSCRREDSGKEEGDTYECRFITANDTWIPRNDPGSWSRHETYLYQQQSILLKAASEMTATQRINLTRCRLEEITPF